jgi:hypothetical protein
MRSALAHNLPLAVTYGMGAFLFLSLPLGWLWALLYVMYVIVSNLVFIRIVCVCCRNFGKRSCEAGYGAFAPRIGNKRDVTNFPGCFKRSMPVVASAWVLPVIGGAATLIRSRDSPLGLVYAATPLVAFCIIAFWAMPKMSKTGCRGCAMRDICPGARLVGK